MANRLANEQSPHLLQHRDNPVDWHPAPPLPLEVALPVLAFGLYLLVREMLAHVANDRHRCEGRPFRAAVWGSAWATVYTLPLAGAVWLLHLVIERRGA